MTGRTFRKNFSMIYFRMSCSFYLITKLLVKVWHEKYISLAFMSGWSIGGWNWVLFISLSLNFKHVLFVLQRLSLIYLHLIRRIEKISSKHGEIVHIGNSTERNPNCSSRWTIANFSLCVLCLHLALCRVCEVMEVTNCVGNSACTLDSDYFRRQNGKALTAYKFKAGKLCRRALNFIKYFFFCLSNLNSGWYFEMRGWEFSSTVAQRDSWLSSPTRFNAPEAEASWLLVGPILQLVRADISSPRPWLKLRSTSVHQCGETGDMLSQWTPQFHRKIPIKSVREFSWRLSL
jgi:hypothetical protein